MFFKVEKKSHDCKARAGLLKFNGYEIPTPVFMPVGTQGTVKAIDQQTLKNFNTRIILSNTYHLYLRPGTEVIEHFGGLHKFISWDRPILTDSGGYQIFSLKELRKLTEDGVHFSSHIDGSKHFFSPESVIDIQRKLGSDIVMVLDECTPYPATIEEAVKSADLSSRWAIRSKQSFISTKSLYGREQYLFSIGQGSVYPDLRKEYLKKMIDIGFDGYAIGGLSVGEPSEIMYEIVDISTDSLPVDKPRYLMGVGTPENILEAIERGIDMFDCVLPTRNARNGQLFTTKGKINIRNAQYKMADEPIDEEIGLHSNIVGEGLETSPTYSLGYLRHLFISGEILGIQLATQQNIAFYLWLVKTAREKILSGEYIQWKKLLLDKYQNSN
ncbi:MAG: tRNA guanosine(34) transglycosylase Tgt [Ignavibacteria bacterium GWB2_35_12]|nr:MAG: tRNA guanosine(34) transglycosylase Tgt [Ignavibacteria bacterium GWA2_35_8]OGU39417.1 MAG: tRNA guanosine(34) transglycosylase Tgt [Ignavibacteria bacterium GWB2_35_12]OGU94555.1 MAG: tRNA guanosine(34) transglycosylase Tgt [Ignavibacteria bacterium RIFOXYA2_FULL_35_10]OGV22432.1 MAG: tRNA guanosine(34) transglycosylase Tgt [Ignavibacteria bacterium RIFOXYC2_FULL_35_21]